MINCPQLQLLHRLPPLRERATRSLCPPYNAVCPGMERSECPARRRSPVGMETSPEPHSCCQAGHQRDLSANFNSLYRQGGRGLAETGGKPAEICKDSIQRSGLTHNLAQTNQQVTRFGQKCLQREEGSSGQYSYLNFTWVEHHGSCKEVHVWLRSDILELHDVQMSLVEPKSFRAIRYTAEVFLLLENLLRSSLAVRMWVVSICLGTSQRGQSSASRKNAKSAGGQLVPVFMRRWREFHAIFLSVLTTGINITTVWRKQVITTFIKNGSGENIVRGHKNKHKSCKTGQF